MKVTVCIGSACHLKGSREIVEIFKNGVEENHLEDKVELSGTFCMKNCQKGVSVSIDDEIFSVTPETAKQFFEEHILK